MIVDQSHLINAGAAGVALFILYCIYWEMTVGAARRKIIREKGCLPANRLPEWEPFYGLGAFRQTIKAVKSHKMLELGRRRLALMGVPTYLLRAAGRDIIITVEPENLKSIQATDFKNWSLGDGRKATFIPFLGLGIFTTDGGAWQHSRTMLRPNFVRTQVADLDLFEVHVKDLIARIPREGQTVDLQDLFFQLTMDSATEFLFGESTGCLKTGTTAARHSKFAKAFNDSQEDVANRGRFGPLGSFIGTKERDANFRFVHKYVDDFVESGLARRDTLKANPSTKRYVFLDELCAQTDDKLQIRSELLNILLAGRDTTASLLSNVFFILSKRPELFAKLRAEVEQRFGTNPPTWQQLKDFKYLQAFLSETLRLYPVVPLNTRQATADTVLPYGGGQDAKSPLFIPKGAVVAWSVYAMHRRPEYFGDDAEEFVPERWLDGPDGKKGLRPGWEYLPFNGGPRICLGQQFALTEAGYTTVRLIQAFKDIESKQDGPWSEWLTLTCTVWGGCHVSLTPA